MLETLEANFFSLDHYGINIEKFRSDSAAYQKEVIDLMEERGCEFFIRANNCKTMWDKINEVEEWEKVRIDVVDFEVAGFQYAPFGEEKEYRIMVSRLPNDTGEAHSRTGEPFVYRCVITNNKEMSDGESRCFWAK